MKEENGLYRWMSTTSKGKRKETERKEREHLSERMKMFVVDGCLVKSCH